MGKTTLFHEFQKSKNLLPTCPRILWENILRSSWWRVTDIDEVGALIGVPEDVCSSPSRRCPLAIAMQSASGVPPARACIGRSRSLWKRLDIVAVLRILEKCMCMKCGHGDVAVRAHVVGRRCQPPPRAAADSFALRRPTKSNSATNSFPTHHICSRLWISHHSPCRSDALVFVGPKPFLLWTHQTLFSILLRTNLAYHFLSIKIMLKMISLKNFKLRSLHHYIFHA